MDKDKIIVNDVDVSECLEFDMHDKTTCKLATLKNGRPIKCTSCWNCYFKFMKREQSRRIELENQCMELEKRIEAIKDKYNIYLRSREAALDRYKHDFQQIANENIELKQRNEQTINKYLKYFLAITTIEDVVNGVLENVKMDS